MEPLQQKVDRLEKELTELKANRFANLSFQEVEALKDYLFERTAAVSGASASFDRLAIITLNGKRGGIPLQDAFTTVA